ncbi:hypothetical protein NXU85_00105 [Phocaeicola vulgatus]|nr:hypothetical protein [Phocaeicola vulgatus]
MDKAINYLTTNNISDILGNQDFIYNGDVKKWGEIRQLFKIKLAANLDSKDGNKSH